MLFNRKRIMKIKKKDCFVLTKGKPGGLYPYKELTKQEIEDFIYNNIKIKKNLSTENFITDADLQYLYFDKALPTFWVNESPCFYNYIYIQIGEKRCINISCKRDGSLFYRYITYDNEKITLLVLYKK